MASSLCGLVLFVKSYYKHNDYAKKSVFLTSTCSDVTTDSLRWKLFDIGDTLKLLQIIRMRFR